MNRRDFVKTTSAALAAAGLMPTGTRLAAQLPTNDHRSTDVVIFLYDRMTGLDAIGPYEVLRCVPCLSKTRRSISSSVSSASCFFPIKFERTLKLGACSAPEASTFS